MKGNSHTNVPLILAGRLDSWWQINSMARPTEAAIAFDLIGRPDGDDSSSTYASDSTQAEPSKARRASLNRRNLSPSFLPNWA